MTKTLKSYEGIGNLDAIFNLEVTDRKGTRNLHCYAKAGHEEGYGEYAFINQCSAMIKDSYTEADHAQAARLAAEEPVRHGDLIELAGKTYRVHVNGDFSDAAKLIDVAA
jgi:hypothetical protein